MNCSRCGTPFNHIVYNPPLRIEGGYFGAECLDTTPHDRIEMDEQGQPHYVLEAPRVQIIKEEWVKACNCTYYDEDQDYGYCEHCEHCRQKEKPE